MGLESAQTTSSAAASTAEQAQDLIGVTVPLGTMIWKTSSPSSPLEFPWTPHIRKAEHNLRSSYGCCQWASCCGGILDSKWSGSLKILNDTGEYTTSDLLKQHVDRAKKIRAGLQRERLRRIERYKQRLALLLPPPSELGKHDGLP